MIDVAFVDSECLRISFSHAHAITTHAHTMLAPRVVCFGALVALLASYYSIYFDAFMGVAVPTSVFDMILCYRLLIFTVLAYPGQYLLCL